MEKEEVFVLKHISDTLDKIYDFISKPLSKWSQIFNTVVAIVGILGIIAIIDVILTWIKS
ncbi:MAG: hypothetical protein FWF68_09915 [Spirochaetes bacterium]|nr:hypothetical protein [Spirochaetota bacterium]